jgi:hypothetical protein
VISLDITSFEEWEQVVKEVDSEEIVEIKEVIYNKFDEEYQYWFVDENGEDIFGFADEFEKVD